LALDVDRRSLMPAMRMNGKKPSFLLFEKY
jgi:hypothetical protein